MQVIESTYVVTLRDYPEDLPAQQRANAERRYAKELEKQFGGLDAKLAAFKATQSYLEQQIEMWNNQNNN